MTSSVGVHPVALFARIINPGDHGPDVKAVKRALKAAGFGYGIVISQLMGGAAVKQLKAFQTHERLPDDGVYGPESHHKLLPWFDAYGASLMQKELDLIHKAADPRNRFLQVADWTVAHKALFFYTMGPARESFRHATPFQTRVEMGCDCSQHWIGCGKWAKLTHPIFDTDAATGAILGLPHTDAAHAQPGDGVVFVGPREPAGHHITLLREKLPNGDWRVVNMGGNGDPSYSTLSAQFQWQRWFGAPTMMYVILPA